MRRIGWYDARILRFGIFLGLGLFTALLARPAFAGPGDKEGYQGLNAARGGFCSRAIPLLEEAESKRHRPSWAVALADCYVKRGQLLKASKIYHDVANEQPDASYNKRERAAMASAKKKAAQLDARLPTLTLVPEASYENLEVEIDGEPVADLSKPQQIAPHTDVNIVARADGYEDFNQTVNLNERARLVLKLRLNPTSKPKPKPAPKPAPRPAPKPEPTPAPKPEPTPEPTAPAEPKPGEPVARKPDTPSTKWIGVGYQGFVIPQFLFNIFGDGGRTFVAPGGEVTLTLNRSKSFDIAVSASYASFQLGDTPFKPKGHPDTDYEIIDSTLQALQANIHFLWSIPLNERRTVSFVYGAGVGIGWTFLGDLHRTQAYPPKGANGDPYRYVKCRGPNNPPGTFRYCNQLDWDANHYNGYAEPSWFDRPAGARPLVYPWLALPEIGISFRESNHLAFDLRAGASVSGILTAASVRFGL